MGHPDLFPVYGTQWGAKNAFGSKTGPHVHCLVEPLVFVGIVNDDPFVFGEGPTGDTLGVENADFPPEIALGNSRIEFPRRWIVEKNRASLRTYGGSGYLDENLEGFVQAFGFCQISRDLQKHLGKPGGSFGVRAPVAF